jgi:FkbM family methyltransferase
VKDESHAPPAPIARPQHHQEFAELLGARIDGYTVIDIGAHGTGTDDVYASALTARDSRVIGFEPDADDCSTLNARFAPRRRYLPFAIGDGQPGSFHHCRSPLVSSLLHPDTEFVARYEGLAAPCDVIGISPIRTVKLDDAVELDSCDFLKIDVQGASLPVLEHATRLLRGTSVVHAEVEFVPIYRGEAPFGEIDRFMTTAGFMFHHFHGIEGRRMLAGGRVVGQRVSQMLWADAVYIPAFDRLAAMSPDALCRLAWTMHTVYGAVDVAMACLAHIPDGAPALANDYQSILSRHGLES